MSDDEKALRAAIKASPLDPLPYAVLNDWLIDQGRDDECRQWFWTTREGVKINVRDLEDSHLWNCVRMIVRRYQLSIQGKKQKNKKLWMLLNANPPGVVIEANRRHFDWAAKITEWIITTPSVMKEHARAVNRYARNHGLVMEVREDA